MVDWLKARLLERTSLDGAVLIAGCLFIIILGPVAKWAAWAGLVYGGWTLLKPELKK